MVAESASPSHFNRNEAVPAHRVRTLAKVYTGLPAVARAVDDQLTMLANGNVRSGLDTLRMLALGMKGVLICHPWALAFATGGEQVVSGMLAHFVQDGPALRSRTVAVSPTLATYPRPPWLTYRTGESDHRRTEHELPGPPESSDQVATKSMFSKDSEGISRPMGRYSTPRLIM